MKAQLKALTEIANSLFMRGHASSFLTKAGIAIRIGISFSFIALGLSGCQNLQTVAERDAAQKAAGHAPTAPGVNPPGAQNVAPPPPTLPGIPALPPPTPNAPVAPPIPTPAFLNKELPKVGVILGAGGMKTFAEIGVLREFQRARIPIQGIVGMEWGAVMGGLYSTQAQVNDVEWKSFKLKAEDLPSHGFLSARIKSAPVSSLRNYLSEIFSSATVDHSKVAFACPSTSVKNDRLSWHDRGQLRDAVAQCLPYPPLFTDNAGSYAEPFAIGDAAAWLRAKGANVIVLVNVMGQGETFSQGQIGAEVTENLLWGEVRRNLLEAKSPVVNWVINVNTTGHPITDFDGRRAVMEAGSKAATDVVNKMATQYGF